MAEGWWGDRDEVARALRTPRPWVLTSILLTCVWRAAILLDVGPKPTSSRAMNDLASNELLTAGLQPSAHVSHRMPAHGAASSATTTYSERRISRNDRRSVHTPGSIASVREEQGAAAVDARQESGGARHSKRRPPLSDDRSWGVQEVAYFLNVSESTVRNLERDGELPALPRIGTRTIKS